MIKQAVLLCFLFLTAHAFPLVEHIINNDATAAIDGFTGLVTTLEHGIIGENLNVILDAIIQLTPPGATSDALVQLKEDFVVAEKAFQSEKIVLADTAKAVSRFLAGNDQQSKVNDRLLSPLFLRSYNYDHPYLFQITSLLTLQNVPLEGLGDLIPALLGEESEEESGETVNAPILSLLSGLNLGDGSYPILDLLSGGFLRDLIDDSPTLLRGAN